MPEDNVVVEQVDRQAASDYLRVTSFDQKSEKFHEEMLTGKRDRSLTAQAFARHRLAAQAHEPSADVVEVRKVETVTGDFMQDEGEPFWRIEIGGYCADFDHEQAARNFAAAIAAMRPESERTGIVVELYRLAADNMTDDGSAALFEAAEWIERGADRKGNGDAE